MAAIQKSTKLNFYKFVDAKPPATSTSEEGIESRQIAVATNKNTEAINNIGDVLNGFMKGIANLNKIELEKLEDQKKNRTKFKAEYNTRKKGKNVLGVLTGIAKGVGNFWDGILNLLGSLFKALVILPALKWLGDPKNRQKVVAILEGIAKVAKFIFDWAKFGVVNTIEGLYKLLSDDTSWWDKLVGFGQAFVGLGAIFLGLRWLKNPFRIITDLFNVLNSFRKNLLRSKSALRRRRGGLGGGRRGGLLKGALLVGGGMLAGAAINQSMQGNDGADGKDGADGANADPETMKKMVDQKFAEYEVEKKSQGGAVKKLPERAQGGFISGPQSGYKVSLDGGRSTSFIGHGTEYVARKANGGAFVVPINTPGTKTQPHLTQKRVSEAKSQGYNVPGFAQGGLVGGKAGQPADPKKRKIFFHWSGGFHNSTQGLPYHNAFSGTGKPGNKNVNYGVDKSEHTAGHNKNSVGLAAAAMGHQGMSKTYYSDKKGWQENPLTGAQTTAMAKEAANLLKAYGQNTSDVDRNVWTHGEWERYAVKTGLLDPPVQRWDLDSLTPGPYNHPGGFYTTKQVRSKGGNQMRAKVKSFLSGAAAEEPSVSPDETGGSNSPQGENRPTPPKRSLKSNFLGLVDAITGNRTDFDGMGQPQRNITNPDQKGEKEANARGEDGDGDDSKTQTMVFPLPNGRFAAGPRQVYGAGRSYGGHAGVDLTELPPFGADPKIPVVAAISGTVLKERYKAGQTYYSGMMIRGVDGYDQRYLHMEPKVKPGQKVNAGDQIGVLYDDADNTHLHFEVYRRGKGGHLNPSQIYPDLFKKGAKGGGAIEGKVTAPGATNPPAAPGADSAANPSSAENTSARSSIGLGNLLPKASSGLSYEERYGSYRGDQDNFNLATKKEEERRAQLQGMLPNMNNSFGPGGPVGPYQGGGMTAKELQKITKDRNNARQLVQTRTQEMIQQVMSQVAQQNGMNQQMAQQASTMIAQMMSQGQAGAQTQKQPQFVPTGGQGRGSENAGAGLLKTTASMLNSNLNPLKGLFQ